jgi:hypothetical protein
MSMWRTTTSAAPRPDFRPDPTPQRLDGHPHMQANLTNASAMAAHKPWDVHAQAELANCSATMKTTGACQSELPPEARG